MARGLIVVFAVLLATGCAEPAPPTLAEGSLETGLAAAIWPDAPALVGDVHCPGLDPELIAQSTTCTADIDAAAVTVDVEIDENGAATATVRETVLDAARAADALLTRLRDDLSIEAIDVVCDPSVVLAADGTVLACVATSGERDIAVELVLGAAGGEEWTLRLAQ